MDSAHKKRLLFCIIASISLLFLIVKTVSAVSPTVTTVGAAFSSNAIETLQGNIIDFQGKTATEHGFQYGTTVAYGATSTESGSFTASLGYLAKWSLQAGSTDNLDVAVNTTTGKVYVSNSQSDTVEEYTTTGTFVTQWGEFGTGNSQFDAPNGIALDKSGNVYVADTGNNRIQKFTSAGAYTTQFSLDGLVTAGGLWGVAVDFSGNIYVVDSTADTVTKLNSNGAEITTWGSAGSSNGQFVNPEGIAVDKSNNIYVADLNNNRVEKFDSNGTYLIQVGSFGSGDGQLSGPTDVVVDVSGTIYIADNGNNRIETFNSSGVYQSQAGSFGDGNGQLNNNTGLAVDTYGNVYVGDTGNTRIDKIGASGYYTLNTGTLSCNSTYHYRAYAINSDGTSYGADATFVSSCSAPTVGDTIISSLTATSATFTGSISDTGGENSSAVGFQYGLTTAFGTTSTQSGSYGTGNFSAASIDLSSFSCRTTIFVRAFATNSIGTSYGSATTFLTSYCPPGLTTGSASGQTDTATTLAGTVTDAASSTVTARGFQYGLTTNYGSTSTDPGTITVPGTYVSQFGSQGSGDGKFGSSGPFDAAVDASGNIYVLDNANFRVEKFNSSGGYVSQWGSEGAGDGQFESAFGIAVNSSNHVFVADTTNDRVEEFTSTGTFVRKWGSLGSGDGQFNLPRDIAFDSFGNIYVTDGSNDRVQKFTSTGVYASQWGSTGSGNGQLSGPYGIAIDSSDNIYVAEGINARIQKFTTAGAYVTQWGSNGSNSGQFSGVEGVGVDSSGNVYTAEQSGNRIQKFTSTGTFITQWGSAGSGNGQIINVYALALDSSDNLYTPESGNQRVEKFITSGGYSLSLSGLTCGSTYHYRAYATNTGGTGYGSDSTFSTSACASSGSGNSQNTSTPGHFSTAPIHPAVSINDNAPTTTQSIVILKLSVSGATEMIISNRKDFYQETWQPFSPTLSWMLDPGHGKKTVYVKYKNYGDISAVASDSIVVDPTATILNTPPPQLPPAQLPTPPAPKVTEPSPQGTSEALTQLDLCPSYLTTIMTMQRKNDPNEVKKLQQFLVDFENVSNISTDGVFDTRTKVAVINFQEKYADDILKIWHFKRGTGEVNVTTMAKINALVCARMKPDLICPYFQYATPGATGENIRHIQLFLNANQDESLAVNGIYDAPTIDAVKRYQKKMAQYILIPWGLRQPTGNVLQTTRKRLQINIGCFDAPIRLPNGNISA